LAARSADWLDFCRLFMVRVYDYDAVRQTNRSKKMEKAESGIMQTETKISLENSFLGACNRIVVSLLRIGLCA